MCLITRTSSSKSQICWPLPLPFGNNLSQVRQSHGAEELLLSSVGLSRWLSAKESSCHAGDMGLIPVLGRSSEEGNGNLFQYSCLGNPMGRGVWRATVNGVVKNRTQLSDSKHIVLSKCPNNTETHSSHIGRFYFIS